MSYGTCTYHGVFGMCTYYGLFVKCKYHGLFLWAMAIKGVKGTLSIYL